MTELTLKNYCVYLNNWPFINNSGRIGMCCKNNWTSVMPPFQTIVNTSLSELWENSHLEFQRNSMLDGNIPRGCNICYDAEKDTNNLNSFRNRSLQGISATKPPTPFFDKKIRAIDLRVGSTCNLACTMCHPSDSSKWFSMYKSFHDAMFDTDDRLLNVKQMYRPSQLNWAEHDSSWENIFNSINSDDLKKIYMAGGEPFYIKKFPEYVTELVNRAPNAAIDINTNGTCRLNDVHLKNLSGKLNLRISIDGYEKSEEYQRLGTNWEEKVAVMDQYTKNFNIKSFDLTITSLTVRQLPKLISFLSNRYPGITIMLRPVINREGLGMNDIPMEMRQDTINFLKSIIADKSVRLNNDEQFLHHLTLPTNIKNKKTLLKTVKYWDGVCPVTLADYDSELSTWVYQ